MNISSVSFSYSKNSMSYRGLLLMDKYLKFSDIIKIDIPICDSNKSDGNVPEEVNIFCDKLFKADILVFSIPEATAHYSAAFKNAMDWLVVKSNFNADLGQKYPISNKSLYVITFTPVYKNAGHRHFEMTKHLLQDKLGADVKNMFVKNYGWDNVIPHNYKFVYNECQEILNTTPPTIVEKKKNMRDDINTWNKQYDEWNLKWLN